jgi:acetyltransferase-like isoleucine patch superfamily enzyme
MIKKLVWSLIRQIQRFYLGHLGENTKIFPGAKLYGKTNKISIGKNSVISSSSILNNSENKDSSINIGDDTLIASYTILATEGGFIKVGNHCSIQPFCTLYGHGGLTIGNYVRIAAHTTIVSANHIFADPHRLIHHQGLSKQGIIIEDDVWIGAGAKILDGCKIGKGSVIGAGTVVIKNVEPYSVVVGVPGKKIRVRGEQHQLSC